ncbi:sterol desaturase family [Xylaria nigripes]|nr:sterol desaturase family [Xylaria nigripes]
MDVLLSLPIFSYFTAPVLTVVPTSLNLLFFYLTWATLVFSHSPLKIELVGTLAVRIVFWLVPSLLSLLFDDLVPSLSKPLKIFGAASLPRRSLTAQAREALLALLNLALFTALQAVISMTATFILHRPPFKTSTTLPLPWHIAKHMVSLYAAREVLTYYIHRYILHSGGMLAELHAQYAHERKGAAPHSLMLYADHPLPLLLSRLLPMYLPSLFIHPHMLTYFLFTLLTTLEEMLCMSGYNFMPGTVIGGVAKRTASHYASGGKGNYGVWGLLDIVHGTRVGKGVPSDIKIETEKFHAKGRGRKTMDSVGKLVQNGIGTRKRSRKGRKRTPRFE